MLHRIAGIPIFPPLTSFVSPNSSSVPTILRILFSHALLTLPFVIKLRLPKWAIDKQSHWAIGTRMEKLFSSLSQTLQIRTDVSGICYSIAMVVDVKRSSDNLFLNSTYTHTKTSLWGFEIIDKTSINREQYWTFMTVSSYSLFRDAFNACCSNLQDLALHSNSFRHIPHPALKPLAANLRTLDLGENQISVVHPNALAGFDELYGLRLAGNQIQSLPEKVFAQADNIKMLNLADNRIQNIEQDVFLPLKSLKVRTQRVTGNVPKIKQLGLYHFLELGKTWNTRQNC